AASYLKKGSSIIFISSIAGYNPGQGLAMYGVTKTALFGLTKALASEMSPDTRVNCIAPGFVPTNFADFLVRDEALRKVSKRKRCLKGWGRQKTWLLLQHSWHLMTPHISQEKQLLLQEVHNPDSDISPLIFCEFL
ncbi:tropinone reductase-like 3, partial [Dendrobium catenatum]|uniref:tropinone reductase-like 3 n=1 Tax=Dendrobium catenatum TaxID=906689 RepID=UPI0010A0B0F1